MARRAAGQARLGSPITALASLQKKEGCLSAKSIGQLAVELNLPAYELYGLASFFPRFHLASPADPELRICRDLSCTLAGSERLIEEAPRLARKARLSSCRPAACPCLGHCDAGPAVELDGRIHTGVTETALWELLESRKGGRVKRPARPGRVRGASSIFPYRKGGAFLTYKSLRRSGSPAEVIAALKESGLRGMGGAGFPAGAKWEIVRNASGGNKTVICNADESEPGTFKDRALMDTYPELVLEGMLIAAWAVGAERGIIYIRHEYGRQRKSLGRALKAAREAGLIGGKRNPHIEIFVSPGGYICGEETALLEVLEGKRAQPRDKPPFPGTHGLFGKPTLINNVETFALMPSILRNGPSWFKSFGRNGSQGFKILGVSGPVKRPGAYETEFGTPVRQILREMAGGLRDGLRLKAFCPGGASSGFLPAGMADIPYDFSSLAEAGSMLGSGALVAIPEGTDMVALAHNSLRFFRDESCGKCVPCRLGTEKLTDFLARTLNGTARADELKVMEDVSAAMMDTSICGLGQAAPYPFLTLLRHFRSEIEEKLKAAAPGGA